MGEKIKVLVVDDEQENLDFLRRTLRRKYEVETATSGAEALQMLEERGPFAVILSDQLMPGMKGTDFLAQAREKVPESVRMILTGYTSEDDSREAVNKANVACFLTKPITSDIVHQAIEDGVALHEMYERNHSLASQLDRKNRELSAMRGELGKLLERADSELAQARRQLASLEDNDALTGLPTHSRYYALLGQEIERVHRYKGTVSVAIGDLDDFAAINKQIGYAKADELLAALTTMLLAEDGGLVRPSDSCCRFSGQAFAFIFPSTPKGRAQIACERIQKVMASVEFPDAPVISMSFGIAEAPADGDSPVALTEAATQALSRAKMRGAAGLERA